MFAGAITMSYRLLLIALILLSTLHERLSIAALIGSIDRSRRLEYIRPELSMPIC